MVFCIDMIVVQPLCCEINFLVSNFSFWFNFKYLDLNVFNRNTTFALCGSFYCICVFLFNLKYFDKTCLTKYVWQNVQPSRCENHLLLWVLKVSESIRNRKWRIWYIKVAITVHHRHHHQHHHQPQHQHLGENVSLGHNGKDERVLAVRELSRLVRVLKTRNN